MRVRRRVFHDRSLLGIYIRGFVMPVSMYCSAVWCSAANTHILLLNRVVGGACFITGVCFNVALHIVQLWRYYVCSGITRYTLFMLLTCVIYASADYMRYTYAEYSCASPLQNLAVSQDFNQPLSISKERSC